MAVFHSLGGCIPVIRVIVLTFGLAILIMSGCGPSSTSSNSTGSTSGNRAPDDSSSSSPVAIQLNWYPESEHGGVFQAEAEGGYQAAGLNVDIRPGGRSAPVAQELALGRVQFGFANADDVVVYRRQGLDVVAVLAAMQDNPRCILVQEKSGVDSLSGLGGLTLQCQAGRPYLEFMRSKGLLEKVKEVPYFGSVAPLVADPKIAIQGYSCAEPLLAEQEGVKVRVLMVSELGWNPYSSVLITTGKLINEQPELVRDFVKATQAGWESYLKDPGKGNADILAENDHGMTADVLKFGSEQMRSLAMPTGDQSKVFGRMSLKRWAELIDQMDVLDPSQARLVKPEDCFTDKFLK
ncbi:MAG: ABC transporter permease [Planctomycetaceae bacterium TMED240]|nr:ABC transporter permease [Rhodopirellula sp.]OUX07769.1 MAG: ABC transporter permease [Planctomycetaceae bacterium TMED240]